MPTLRHRKIFLKLRQDGLRLTRARKNLIEHILEKKGHWTIQDLTDESKTWSPRIGVATIYRTVGLLHRSQLISETRFGGGSARYEVSTSHHHDHLTCLKCGQLFEFENSEIERLQESVAKRLGFKLSDHRMELFGDCQRSPCKYNRANSVTPRQKTVTKSTL